MFKYQHIVNEHSFRQIAYSKDAELRDQLAKFKRNINADIVFIAARKRHIASTLIILDNTGKIDNLTYELNGTPCQEVSVNKVCCFPHDVCQLFPDDKELQELCIDGYIGSAIQNEDGADIGILVALYMQPQEDTACNVNMFELFTQYISTYIQKCHLDNRSSSHLSLLNEVEALSNTGSWEYYVNTGEVFWSDEVFNIYNLSVSDASSVDKALSFYVDHDRIIVTRLFDRAITKGTSYEVECEIIDAHGTKKWVKTSGVAVCDDDGNVMRVYGAFEDITASKNLQLQDEERVQRVENILNNLNDAVIAIDSNGAIQQYNQVALRIFGYQAGELDGVNISTLMPESYASAHHKYMAHYNKTGETRIIGVGRQLPAKRKNGDVFQMELAITKSVDNGETQYIGVIRDITERLEAQDTIYNLAFTDNVTLLRNSQWFEKECKELMHRAGDTDSSIHILLLNIDKMAQLNLQVGFHKGDLALKMVANKLKEIIGSEYNIYAYDAGAFVILSTNVYSKSHLYKFRPTIIEKTLLHPSNFIVDIDEQLLTLTASLSSAIFDPTKQSFEGMLNILERALKRAKKEAPFGCHYVVENNINEYYRYLTIQESLKTVVDNGELSLVMQPQYNDKGKLNSFEALIRWQSSEFGNVSPVEFIPIAEESDTIITIGDWVLLNGCKAIKELINKGLKTSVSINLSAKQIVAVNFSSKLVKLVKKYNIPPKMLMLELTETALVADIEIVKHTMNELSHHGFRFSVDDFGTGYSSLAYLKELPIYELKIDKYFVDDIEVNDVDTAYPIVDAVIDMAKALGVKCVAEGVEHQAQYDYLKRKACDIYQGYLFSKPVNMKTWREMISIESEGVQSDAVQP